MKDMAIQVANRPSKPKLGPVQKVIDEVGDEINLVAKLEEKRAVKIGEVGVTDFTEIVYDNGLKKAQLMTILEYNSRVVLGWEIAERKNTQLALSVWQKTRVYGLRIKECAVHERGKEILLHRSSWLMGDKADRSVGLSQLPNCCRKKEQWLF